MSEIVCDRCGTVIHGYRGEFATAGFYDVSGQTWWSQYARPNEANVCDACMWADPHYQADYGIRPASSPSDSHERGAAAA